MRELTASKSCCIIKRCSDIEIKCAKTLFEKKLNIAFIESVTAGRMCSEFALTEYSGQILRGGLVCYSVFVKDQFLHVPQKLIEMQTPESILCIAKFFMGNLQRLYCKLLIAQLITEKLETTR